MKKKKKLIGLISAVVILILLSAVYIGLRSYNQEKAAQESETEDTSIIISAVPETDITEFSYIYNEEKLEFIKEVDVWYYAEDKEFPLDQDKVKTLIGNFASVKAIRDLGQQENLEEYGLKEPVNQISVTKESGSETVFYIGNKNTTTGNYYLYMDNAEHIYTTDGTLINAFTGKLYDLAATESLPAISAGSVTKVEVVQKDNTFTLESAQDDSAVWKVKDSDNKEKTADSTKTVELFNNLTSLSYKELIDYNCKDLKQYGLQEPSAQITIDYTNVYEEPAESEVLVEGETDGVTKETDEMTETEAEETSENETSAKTVTEKKQVVLLIGSQDENGDSYVKLSDSNQIYTISADTLKPWLEAAYRDYLEAK